MFDLCIVSFQELRNDARSLNLAKTLASLGRRVCFVAIGSKREKLDFFEKAGVFFPIDVPAKGRAWRRFARFAYSAKKLIFETSAKNYLAADAYSLPIASNFAEKRNAKLLYDSRELYFALLGDKRKFRQKILSSLEKKYIQKVDKIIVSGELDAKYLRYKYLLRQPIEILMNLPPYRKAEGSNLLRETYSIDNNKRIIIYQGVILPGRGLIKSIGALHYLNDIVLCILGDGAYKDEVRKTAETLGVSDKVIFCGAKPYNQLHSWTCSADLGLVLIEPVSFSYKLALPNKLFEYFMAGVPPIVSRLPAMEEIINKTEAGILIEPEAEPRLIAFAIEYALKRKRYKALINRSLKAAKEYNYEKQTEKIINLLETA